VPLVMPLGAAIGLMMGLTGAGGGILAVPALVMGLGLSMTQAAPIALAAVGIAAAVGALDGLNRHIVRYKAAALMAVLGALCSHVGIRLAHIIPDTILTALFSALMLMVAVRMLRRSVAAQDADPVLRAGRPCMLDPATGRLRWTRQCACTLAGIGATAGLFAGMLGVGGGFVIVPAFRRYTNVDMQGIVATSLMVIALISLATVAGVLLHGTRIPETGWVFVGSAVAGMIAGRAGARHVQPRLLQIAFAAIAALVALMLAARLAWPGLLAGA
jgi:uncharacterized membrane protein YfcA